MKCFLEYKKHCISIKISNSFLKFVIQYFYNICSKGQV